MNIPAPARPRLPGPEGLAVSDALHFRTDVLRYQEPFHVELPVQYP
jgi:hypothetical protein